MNMKAIYFLTIFFLSQLFSNCSNPKKQEVVTVTNKIEKILNDHTLNLWYPRVIDQKNGGYYSNFTFDWNKKSNQDKFIVTQARHVWTLAKAYEFYPEKDKYEEYAKHGFEFLRDFMWDKEFGGFYQLVDSVGNIPDGHYNLEKRAYGNAFGIYALAAYYKLSDDPEALDVAIKAFHWLDDHAHDSEFGGYFQYLYQDGTPIPRSVLEEGYDAGDKAHVGLKDYNSSIHILEAFTELHHVWPDEKLRDRLMEMYMIVSDTMYDQRGFLKLHFYPDWTEVKDEELTAIVGERSFYTNHVTFGHDVETAFLLLEAAHELNIPENEVLPKAKLFVDHALEKGWDSKKGGFYDQGKYIEGQMKIIDEGKNWWAQAEGLNSLLLMHTKFPNDSHNYYNNFLLQLSYIEENLLDHNYMGWYSGGVDHHPEFKERDKAQIWKGTYHTARSLMNCIYMLREQQH